MFSIMRLLSCFFIFAIPVAFGATHAERQTQVDCYEGVNILGLPYLGGASLGIMDATANAIESAIDGSEKNIVLYDSGNANHSIAIADGVKKLRMAIRKYYNTCPGRPMVLLGHSLGGIVIMNTLCDGLEDSFKPNIISAIAYGEETYVPGQPWSKGGCKEAGGMSKPRQNPDACLPWKAAIKDYCVEGDGYCCAGTDLGKHFGYNEFDDAMVKFVVRRYNKLGKPE